MGIRLLALAAVLLGMTVVAQPADAAEAPGVYDVATDRTIYPAAGTMTVTWRAVVPAGDTPAGANCTLTVNGVQQSPVSCASGVPFTYPDSGFRGYDLTNSSVTVTQFYVDPNLTYLLLAGSQTKSIQFDGGIPTAGVSGFNTFDIGTSQAGGTAPDPMRPGTPYQASLVWHDNLHIQSTSCWLERASAPGTVLNPVSCGSIPGQSGSAAIFTTPTTSGTYLYVVKVTDPAGNSAQASKQFSVDASPPVLTFTSGPANGGATNAAIVSWSWTADESATYKCWVGDQGAGSVLTSCSSPFAASGLSEGAKQIQIQATDGYGNMGITTVNFTVDRTKPSLTLNKPSDGATFTSTLVAYDIRSSEPVSFLCSMNPDAGAASYGSCAISGYKDQAVGGIRAPGWGTYRYGFKGVDAAGNVSDPVTFTYTTSPPPAPLTWQSGPHDSQVTRSSQPTWTWTTTDPTSTYDCSLKPHGEAPTVAACSSPYAAPAPLLDGTYDFTVRAHGDNSSAQDNTTTFTVDTTSPAAGSVRITGTPRVGLVVSAAGSWPSGVGLRYQWKRDGSSISGATRSTYRVVPTDLKHRITVAVVGKRVTDSHQVTITTAAITVVPGVLTSGRARIVGVLKVGKKLTASATPWTAGTTVRCQWFANGKKIAGATRATLTLGKNLARKRIKVVITGSHAGYQSRALTVSRPRPVHW